MLKICFSKSIVTNGKLFLISILFIVISLSCVSQKKTAKDYQKEKDQQKQERKEADAEKYEKLKQHQYDIQSKSVKKRMEENKKATDSYYSNKTHRCFILDWFSGKEKRR
jgi:cell division protein FtsL